MKTILVALIGCAIISTGISLVLRPASPLTAAEPAVVPDGEITALRGEVAGLREGQEDVRAQLSAITTRLIALAGESGADISGAAASPAASPATDVEAEEASSLDEALDVLTDPSLDWEGKQPVWNELARRGRIDDAVAFLEERARDNPDSAEAQAEYGHACIQKIFTVGELEKGVWAMRADKAYDAALAIDDHHWEARFSKAVCYSFMPAVLGMQERSIEQFEILRTQQESGSPQRHFAETYSYLGNLYSNRGDAQKAQETWRRGLELYPDHKELKARVGEKTEE